MGEFIKSLTAQELLEVKHICVEHSLAMLRFELIRMTVKRYGAKKALGMVPVSTAANELAKQSKPLFSTNNKEMLKVGKWMDEDINKRSGKVGRVWRAAKQSIMFLTLGATGLALGGMGIGLSTQVYNYYNDLPNVGERFGLDVDAAREFLQIRQALYQDALGEDDPWSSDKDFTDKLFTDQRFVQLLVDNVTDINESADKILIYEDEKIKDAFIEKNRLYSNTILQKKALKEYVELESKLTELKMDEAYAESSIIGKFSSFLKAGRRWIKGELSLKGVNETLEEFDKTRFEKNKENTLGDHIPLDFLEDMLEDNQDLLEKVASYNKDTKEKKEDFRKTEIKEAYIKKLKVKVYNQLLDPKNIGGTVNGQSYSKHVKAMVNLVVPEVFEACLKVESNDYRYCNTLENVILLFRSYYSQKYKNFYNKMPVNKNKKVDDNMIKAQNNAFDMRDQLRYLQYSIGQGLDMTEKMIGQGLNVTNVLDNARVTIRAFQEIIPVIFPNATPSISAFFNQVNAEIDSTLFFWTVYFSEMKRTEYGFLKIGIPPMIVSASLLYLANKSQKKFNKMYEGPKMPDMDTKVKIFSNNLDNEVVVPLKLVMALFFPTSKTNVKANDNEKMEKMKGFFSMIVYRYLRDFMSIRRKTKNYHLTNLAVISNTGKTKESTTVTFSFLDQQYAFFWRNMIFELMKLHVNKKDDTMYNKLSVLLKYDALRVFDRAFVQPLFDDCKYGLKRQQSNPNSKFITYYSIESNPYCIPKNVSNKDAPFYVRDYEPYISSFVLVRIMHHDVRFTTVKDLLKGKLDDFSEGTELNEYIVKESVSPKEGNIRDRMKNMKVKIGKKEVELLNENELKNAQKFLSCSMICGKDYNLLNTNYHDAARHFMTMLKFGLRCSKRIDISEI